jgi:hypothetical protein
MGVMNIVRDYVVGVAGAVTGVKTRRELRESRERCAHLEAVLVETKVRVEDGERDLRKGEERLAMLEERRRDQLRVIFSDRLHCWDAEELKEAGVDVMLAEDNIEKAKEIKGLNEAFYSLKLGYLGHLAKDACEAAGVGDVSTMVYFDGSIVYANGKFDSLFTPEATVGSSLTGEQLTLSSRYSLASILKEERGLGDALGRGKGFAVDLDDGKMIFVPMGKRMGKFGVAHYLSNDELEDRVAKKAGNRAVARVRRELKKYGARREVGFA